MILSLLLAGLIVGVTDTCPTNGNAQAEGDYFWALEKAGHSAVLIARGNDAEQVRRIVASLDAVLITGGGDDINGAPYDVPTESGEGRPNPERNRLEDLVLAECLRTRKPILGICRGMQFLNVRFGGSLYQDIPTSKAFTPKDGIVIEHRPGEWADNVTNPPAHTVEIVPGSRLAKVIGTEPFAVVSHHHQAPYKVAPGFRVTASAPDGVVECIESADYPIVGFQFHPERAVGSTKHPGYDIPRTLKIFQELLRLLQNEPRATSHQPVKPILPANGTCYWNKSSKLYIHPPAFDFAEVGGATDYRFYVVCKGITNVFAAATPRAALSPVWGNLPRSGAVDLTCEGVDASGKAVGLSGKASFWKNAAFREGAYPQAKRSYADASRMVYDYLFAMPYVKTLAATGKPDPAYRHNCYPSKMNGALIRAALRYAELTPEKRDEAMKAARAAADYLIVTAEPEDAPLAFFPQTYDKEIKHLAAVRFAGQHMLCYPATAGSAILELYRATKEGKYLAAAERIAATYLKLQGEDGTWNLKMRAQDGAPVGCNRLFPLDVCEFLESLYGETKNPAYRAAADRAFAFVEKGPLATWNWEGQFEDVDPSALYRNLTKHSACDTAMYLVKRYPGDAARLAQARALLDFSEDQFVVWERPCEDDGRGWFGNPKIDPRQWTVFPTALEQYEWYIPTDSSVAKMVRTFLALHKASGEPQDLAKARALGDAFTRAQEDSGRIPTQWTAGCGATTPKSDWINCMISSAVALGELAEAEGPEAPNWLADAAKRTVVSDTNRFTCGSGSVACLSADGKRIFAPYLASMTGFGECHDLTALADVPVAAPEKAKSFVLLKAGDVFCGATVTTTVSFASFVWKQRVRVMVDVNFNVFGYREWDPETCVVSGEGLFKCRYGGQVRSLSPEAISECLTEKGMTEFCPCKERGDRCIWQSKPVWRDGAFYGFVTSSCSQPILFRCADGETFEFVGVLPAVVEYECQLAFHKGLFYAVMRGAKKDNFWISADGGVTWQACGCVPDGLQRQQLLVWRDKVLIGYSAPDEQPNGIRNGRNNLHLLWGEGPDLSAYRELMHAVDPLGIVYPDLVDIGGDLHVLWSNSGRFPKHVKWGAVQGKDQLLHARLGAIGIESGGAEK